MSQSANLEYILWTNCPSINSGAAHQTAARLRVYFGIQAKRNYARQQVGAERATTVINIVTHSIDNS
jgi:hypothetical protein